MQRYIDPNKIRLISDFAVDGDLDILVPLIDVIKAVRMTPSEDVAPKSEVAKEIFDELDKFIVTRFVYYGAPEYDVSDKYIEVKKKYDAYNPVPIKTLTNSRKRIICAMRKRKLNKSEDTK